MMRYSFREQLQSGGTCAMGVPFSQVQTSFIGAASMSMLAQEPLEVLVKTEFSVGDRVQVSDDFFWAKGATGTQAPREGFTEITSGRSRRQQGLVATCRDSSNEA